jgi:hypothetical protein
MPRCFWSACTCPDSQPCAEHNGAHCSEANGGLIAKVEDVDDALTQYAELSLIRMDDDGTRLEVIRGRLETRYREMEDEKRRLDLALANARSYSDRRAAVKLADQLNAKYRQVDQDMRSVEYELEILAEQWRWASARVLARLVQPYADPSGYCLCYDTKKQRLAAIQSLFAAEQTAIAATMAQLVALRNEQKMGYGEFGKAKQQLTLFGLMVVLAWVIVGLTPAGAAAALIAGGLILILLLWARLMHMRTLVARLHAAQRRLLKLFLLYYRVQQISTCRTATLADLNAWDWWEKTFKELDADIPLEVPPPLPPALPPG